MKLNTQAWQKTRAHVLERDGWTCLVPVGDDGMPDEDGEPHGIALTRHDVRLPTHASVDHIVTRTDGGTDMLDNLRAACRRCNSRRAAAATNAGRAPAPLNTSRDWWAGYEAWLLERA